MRRLLLFLIAATILPAEPQPVTHLFLGWGNVDPGDTRFPVDRTKVSAPSMRILEETRDYYSVELSEGRSAPWRFNTAAGVRVVVEPARTTGPWLRPDKPWEVRGLYEGTVLQDGGKYRLWYPSFYDRGEVIQLSDGRRKLKYGVALCYAESSDGVHWTKPALGLVDFHGDRNNNMITMDPRISMGVVFLDPIAAPAERYKILNPAAMHEFDPNSKANTPVLAGGTSADGIHWTTLEKPLWIGHNSDTFSGVYVDTGKRTYTGFFRSHHTRRRSIARSETSDFRSWPLPVTILAPGPEEAPSDDFYTPGYVRHPGVADAHMMMASIYHRDISTLDVRLASSADGAVWNWVSREPIIRQGAAGSWLAGKIFVCPEMVRLPDGTVAVPTLGFSWAHNEFWRDYYEEGFARTVGFGWAIWDDGRIAGIAARQAGQFTTLEFDASGAPIEVNVRSSTSGYVQVECLVTTARGKPPVIHRARDLVGDHPWARLVWDDGFDPATVAGKKVRLRFTLYDAVAFGFRI